MQLPNQLFFEHVEATLAQGHEVQIRVKGHSMRPLLRDGRDSVVLRACSPKQLRTGDIVLFRCGSRHILHRIVQRDGEQLILSGDGNHGITERCTTRDVAAIVVRVIRASGRTIRCVSPAWKLQSRCWLALPPGVRRFALRALWHIGYK